MIHKNEWNVNPGMQPVKDGVGVDVMFHTGLISDSGDSADTLSWDIADGIMYWKLHKTDEDTTKEYLAAINNLPVDGTLTCDGSTSLTYHEGDKATPSPMPEVKPAKVVSDGLSTSYYKLTITNKAGETIDCEVGDVIRCMCGDNFNLGNIIKACRRMYEASNGKGKKDVTIQYDANKISYFAKEFATWYKGGV